MRLFQRVLVCAVGAAAVVVVGAAAASAHVVVTPSSAPAGSSQQLSFRVPNEQDAATTVKLTVAFPDAPPIPSVAVRPVPGWTVQTTTKKLAQPIQTDDGPVSDYVSEVTWTAGPGQGIAPGQYQDFDVSAGPLPDTPTLAFKALQTYSNGDVVRWIEQSAPGQPEPDNPAPTLQVTAASATPDASPAAASSTVGTTSSSGGSSSDTAAVALAVAGVVVAVAALGVGGVAFARTRRRG